MEIRKNKALQEAIKWIEENPYTEKIISVSKIEFIEPERKEIRDSQQDYPIRRKFTATVKVVVTYQNANFGKMRCTIYAGFDSVAYRYAYTSAYNGDYMDNHDLISVWFVGEDAVSVTERLEHK